MRFVTRLFIIILLSSLINISVQAGGKKIQLFQELSPGLNIYRYEWDVETCVMYVAEISRDESTLQFEVALGNSQVLGKETVRSMAEHRNQKGDPTGPRGSQRWVRCFRGYAWIRRCLGKPTYSGWRINHTTNGYRCMLRCNR